jgi:hypothetical protein
MKHLTLHCIASSLLLSSFGWNAWYQRGFSWLIFWSSCLYCNTIYLFYSGKSFLLYLKTFSCFFYSHVCIFLFLFQLLCFWQLMLLCAGRRVNYSQSSLKNPTNGSIYCKYYFRLDRRHIQRCWHHLWYKRCIS